MLAYRSKLSVILKILSSEVSVDSDINYMPVLKFFACLDFERKASFCKRLIFMEFFIIVHESNA